MRNKINFDGDWRFRECDLPPRKPTDGWGGAKARAYDFGVPFEDFDDSAWQEVTLPHDFVDGKEYCFKSEENAQMRNIPEMESIGSRLFAGGCLEGGVAWYRKRFTLNGITDKRVYLHFDGVYRCSDVYINRYFVGHREDGYAGFYYDVTDFVNEGDNVIAVRVDASEREGWWYEGGGIYRHVWLEVTEKTHIPPWGVYVYTKICGDTAKVHIKAEIINRDTEDFNGTVGFEITDGENTVYKSERQCAVTVWRETEICDTAALGNFRRWSIDDPFLYTAVITVSNGDRYSVPFGVRETCFDADKGFFLNGERVKIKGVCLHHDHAGVGTGIPESVHEYRIKRLKEMGANAVRISHYPAAPELLDICDRLGMLVYEETRRMSSAPEDLERLRAMVKRDRNHPSIFLWGIGNEEIFSQHRPETAKTTVTMKSEIKRLDDTRPVTSAVVCWDGKERFDNARSYIPVTKNLDVMGFNYCRGAWDDYHKRMPEQPIIITECSSNSGTRGCYSTDESKGLYYIFDDDNISKVKAGEKAVKKDMGETDWKICAENDWISGLFVWTGFDYRGEPTPLGYPAVYSRFGIFDYCGFPKDNYYYYKSWWQDEKVIHIFPHWNYDDGQEIDVYCYSNCDEAELFVNGRSRGRRKIKRNWYAVWEKVKYESGEAKAVGYINGGIVTETTVKTAGEPAKIEAVPYKSVIAPNDTAIINIRVTDKNGITHPTADNELRFEIEGGKVLGTGNGDPADHSSDKINVRRAFNGLCRLLVSPNGNGEIKVTISSVGLESSECVIICE